MEKTFICDWIDRLNNENENEVDEVMIKLSKCSNASTKGEDDKLITIHVYFTTFLTTVQRNFYKQWVDEEFEYLKAVVNEITTNTLQVLNLTSEDLAITPKSPRILQPSPKVGQSLQGMIQAVENRVCEHLKLIENKLSRFEERITKIKNDVDVLRTVEEKLNINEDRTGNLEKELQKIIQREKECNTKDSQIKSMKKEILKQPEEIHKAQKDLEELI